MLLVVCQLMAAVNLQVSFVIDIVDLMLYQITKSCQGEPVESGISL